MPITASLRRRIIRTIPKIEDKVLFELFANIKPVHHLSNFWYDEIADNPGYSLDNYVKGVSFIWNPVLAGKVQMMFPIGETCAYHTWGAPTLFKPSLAEVFAVLQHLDLTDVTHFHLVHDNNAALLSKPDRFGEDGYHKSKITLLTSLQPGDIRNNDVPIL